MFQFEAIPGSKKAGVFLYNFSVSENKFLFSILNHFFPCFFT